MRVLIVLMVLLFAQAAYAQSDFPSASSAVTIAMSPAQPVPNSTVRLTLQSPIFDLSQSLVSWRVDGELLTEGEGVTSVSIQVKAAGETTDVSASVVTSDEEALAFLSITPASLDLLWEAEGFAPALYKGRTLPSPGANITLVAHPTFVRGGAPIAEKDLIYTWRKGNTVLGSLSGKGRSTLVVDGTTLFGEEVFSVDARTADGEISARGSARIPAPDTSLRLYENHPLFGPLYHRAFSATAFTPETEMTFLAIPYFAPVTTENDPRLQYAWRVDRNSIVSDAKKPSQITINAAGSTGIATIDLEVTHVTNYFFGTNAAWQITFSQTGGSIEGINPFAPRQ